MSSADPFEHDDAAYVLGLLAPAERTAFETHLQSCAACAERVRELNSTAQLLSRLDESDVLALEREEPLPDTLLPGLLRRAGVSRRRQRWITTGLSGVAAACLVALAVLLWPAAGTSQLAQPQALVAVTQTPLRATATVTKVSWGTRITLECSYRDNEPPATAYTYGLTVITRDGIRHQLGTWTVGAGKDVKFTSGIAVSNDDIRVVQITTYDGTPVLALNE